MKTVNQNYEIITTCLEAFESEQLSCIDFDLLSSSLRELCQNNHDSEKLATELSLLRDDYRARIAGMIKAIAVASRSDTALNTALDDIAALETLDTAGLIEQYRRVSARFRDCFRASFMPPASCTRSHSRSYSEFK